MDHQPAHVAPFTTGQELNEARKTEPAKVEEVKAEPEKFALNLEQTLKSVVGLHRLSIQRIALLSRIKTLEDFEAKSLGREMEGLFNQ